MLYYYVKFEKESKKIMTKRRKLERLYQGVEIVTKEYTLEQLLENKDGITTSLEGTYHRELIWDNVEATNLVETILLNYPIQPFIMMEDNKKRNIIDGKQRYLSLLYFYQNKFKLKEKGLTTIKDLYGKYYKDLPPNTRTIFEDYPIKAQCYIVKDKTFTKKDIDFLQRDIYRRHNYGNSPLKYSDIERAQYLHDQLTREFIMFFRRNPDIYQESIEIFFPKTKKKMEDEREKINILMTIVRKIIVTPYIPIVGEKSINIGRKIVIPYYNTFFGSISTQQCKEILTEYKKIVGKLSQIKKRLILDKHELQDNILFYQAAYWMFSILYEEYSNEFYQFNIEKLCHYLEEGGENYFKQYNSNTSGEIQLRYEYLGAYIQNELKIDFDTYKEKIKENKSKTRYKRQMQIDKDEVWNGMRGDQQLTSNVIEKMTVEKIIKKIKDKKFIIQSAYQRAEVKNIYKASKVIESIFLGIPLPPIYLHEIIHPKTGTRTDTVMDRTTKVNRCTCLYGSRNHK